VFASTIHPIPSKSKSEYQLLNEVGISVLTIKNSDLLLKCRSPTDKVYLNVKVQAANELINATPTLINYAFAKD